MMVSFCWFESHPFPMEDQTISLLAASSCTVFPGLRCEMSVKVLCLPSGTSSHSAIALNGTQGAYFNLKCVPH